MTSMTRPPRQALKVRALSRIQSEKASPRKALFASISSLMASIVLLVMRREAYFWDLIPSCQCHMTDAYLEVVTGLPRPDVRAAIRYLARNGWITCSGRPRVITLRAYSHATPLDFHPVNGGGGK